MKSLAQMILATVYILYMLIGTVTSSCEAFNACFKSYTKVGATTYEGALDGFCQHKDALVKCYDKIQGCPQYEAYMEVIQDKDNIAKQLEFLCKHKDTFLKAIDCTAKKILKIPYDEIMDSIACSAKISIKGTDYCKYMSEMVKCYKVLGVTYRCVADIMILMEKNGLTVSCIDIYKSMVSGSDRSGSDGSGSDGSGSDRSKSDGSGSDGSGSDGSGSNRSRSDGSGSYRFGSDGVSSAGPSFQTTRYGLCTFLVVISIGALLRL